MNELVERFISRARAVSAEVLRVQCKEQALEHVLGLRSKDEGVAAVGWDSETAAALARSIGGDHLFEHDLRSHVDAVDVGFTRVDWGIAETGTLVMNGVDEDLRLATMLPAVHVALLEEERIVKRMADLTEEIAQALSGPPGYLAMITGPSRTADVERVLTIGVHGPRRLQILLLGSG